MDLSNAHGVIQDKNTRRRNEHFKWTVSYYQKQVKNSEVLSTLFPYMAKKLNVSPTSWNLSFSSVLHYIANTQRISCMPLEITSYNLGRNKFFYNR